MAIFAHIKIEHKETQTDQGQLIFYLTSTDGSLFSIILSLRIVWRLKRLDPKRVTAIYRRYYWCSFSVIVIFWKLTSCQNEREALRREGFCNNLHSTFHLAEYLYGANKCNANLPPPWAGGAPSQNMQAQKSSNSLQNIHESSRNVFSKWNIALTLQYDIKCH